MDKQSESKLPTERSKTISTRDFKISESEGRYRRLTEAITDYIFTVRVDDGKTIETIHGNNCEVVTGYTSDEFAANPMLWIAMVPAEDRATVEQQAACILSGRRSPPIEHRIQRKDGEIRWVTSTVSPQHDEQGRLIAYDGLLRDITDRKQAEGAVRQLNETLEQRVADQTGEVRLLAEALANLGEGVLISSDHLNWPGPEIVYVNKAMCRITGYTAEELIGQTPRILQGEKTDKKTIKRLRRELSEKRSHLCELVNYRKDGTSYDAELFISPLFNAEGNQTHFIAIHRDVSQRKQGEGRRAAQYGLTRLLAQSPTIDEAIPEVLRVICEGLGWQFGEIWQYDPVGDVLRNTFIWNVSSLDVQEFITATRETCFRRGEGLIGRVWSEGRPCWVTDIMADSAFVRASAGHAVGLRACFAFPISNAEHVDGVAAFFGTESREPDHELLNHMEVFGKQVGDFIQRKHVEKSLHEREERMRAILDTAADAIISIDRRGIIDGVNPATENMFGYTQRELVGHNVKILMSPPYSDEHDGYIARYLKTGEPHIIGTGREVVARRKDGSTFPIDLAVSEIDHLGMFTGIIRDISERKAAHERLLQAERLAGIGEAMTGLTHESRNALARSQANLRRLSRRLNDQPELLALIDAAIIAQEDLRQLFEDVRQYAAPVQLQLQLTDVGKLINETWEQLAPSREGRDAILRQARVAFTLECEMDSFHISHAIRNILENALAACEDPVEIDINYSEVQIKGRPFLRIAIRDNGPGLRSDQAENVFNAFYTTRTQGTGLGLAIVKRAVEQHGGEVTIGPDACEGAEFTLTLPRKQQ